MTESDKSETREPGVIIRELIKNGLNPKWFGLTQTMLSVAVVLNNTGLEPKLASNYEEFCDLHGNVQNTQAYPSYSQEEVPVMRQKLDGLCQAKLGVSYADFESFFLNIRPLFDKAICEIDEDWEPGVRELKACGKVDGYPSNHAFLEAWQAARDARSLELAEEFGFEIVPRLPIKKPEEPDDPQLCERTILMLGSLNDL